MLPTVMNEINRFRVPGLVILFMLGLCIQADVVLFDMTGYPSGTNKSDQLFFLQLAALILGAQHFSGTDGFFFSRSRLLPESFNMRWLGLQIQCFLSLGILYLATSGMIVFHDSLTMLVNFEFSSYHQIFPEPIVYKALKLSTITGAALFLSLVYFVHSYRLDKKNLPTFALLSFLTSIGLIAHTNLLNTSSYFSVQTYGISDFTLFFFSSYMVYLFTGTWASWLKGRLEVLLSSGLSFLFIQLGLRGFETPYGLKGEFLAIVFAIPMALFLFGLFSSLPIRRFQTALKNCFLGLGLGSAISATYFVFVYYGGLHKISPVVKQHTFSLNNNRELITVLAREINDNPLFPFKKTTWHQVKQQAYNPANRSPKFRLQFKTETKPSGHQMSLKIKGPVNSPVWTFPLILTGSEFTKDYSDFPMKTSLGLYQDLSAVFVEGGRRQFQHKTPTAYILAFNEKSGELFLKTPDLRTLHYHPEYGEKWVSPEDRSYLFLTASLGNGIQRLDRFGSYFSKVAGKFYFHHENQTHEIPFRTIKKIVSKETLVQLNMGSFSEPGFFRSKNETCQLNVENLGKDSSGTEELNLYKMQRTCLDHASGKPKQTTLYSSRGNDRARAFFQMSESQILQIRNTTLESEASEKPYLLTFEVRELLQSGEFSPLIKAHFNTKTRKVKFNFKGREIHFDLPTKKLGKNQEIIPNHYYTAYNMSPNEENPVLAIKVNSYVRAIQPGFGKQYYYPNYYLKPYMFYFNLKTGAVQFSRFKKNDWGYYSPEFYFARQKSLVHVPDARMKNPKVPLSQVKVQTIFEQVYDNVEGVK